MTGKLRCWCCGGEHKADTYHFPKYIETPIFDENKKVIGSKITGYICRKCAWKDERELLIKQFGIVKGTRKINDVLHEKLQDLKRKEEQRRKKLCEKVSPSTSFKKPGLIRSIISSLRIRRRSSTT